MFQKKCHFSAPMLWLIYCKTLLKAVICQLFVIHFDCSFKHYLIILFLLWYIFIFTYVFCYFCISYVWMLLLFHLWVIRYQKKKLKITIINWWKGKPSGSIACTRKQQPRFYWSRSSVVLNDATPLTPPSAWAELHFQM